MVWLKTRNVRWSTSAKAHRSFYIFETPCGDNLLIFWQLLLSFLAEQSRNEFTQICLVLAIAYILIPLFWNWSGTATDLYFKGSGYPSSVGLIVLDRVSQYWWNTTWTSWQVRYERHRVITLQYFSDSSTNIRAPLDFIFCTSAIPSMM